MIHLTCSSCQAALEVDDAFGGGVCRCSHCAAIQTVPKQGAGPAVGAAVSPQQGKTLFRKQGRAMVGSGLDELAQVVASSGLGSTRLRGKRSASSRNPSSAVADVELMKRKYRSLLIFGSVAGVVVVALLGFLMLRSGGPGPGGASVDGGAGQTAPAAAAGERADRPGFASIDLTGATSVVYLVDRGGASSDVLSALKQTTLASVGSLKPSQRFSVLMWSNGTPEAGYPGGSLASAVPEMITSARRVLDDVVAFGQSDVSKPLKTALSLKPDAVIILTAKGFDLDDGWADAALAERNLMSPFTKLHTVSVGSTPQSPVLRKVSERTGGVYLEMSAESLRELVR